MTFLELNDENIKGIADKVINHTYYGDEKHVIHDLFHQFKYNNNLNEFAIKIASVDLTNSTHLSQHKEKISAMRILMIVLQVY